MKMRLIGSVAALAVVTSGAFYASSEPVVSSDVTPSSDIGYEKQDVAEPVDAEGVEVEGENADEGESSEASADALAASEFIKHVLDNDAIDVEELERNYDKMQPDTKAIQQMQELLNSPDKTETLAALAAKVRKGIEKANPETLKRLAAKLLADVNFTADQLTALTPDQRAHFGTYLREERGKTISEDQHGTMKHALLATPNEVTEKEMKEFLHSLDELGYDGYSMPAMKKFLKYLTSDSAEAKKIIEVLNAALANPDTLEKAKQFVDELLAETPADSDKTLMSMLQALNDSADDPQFKEIMENFDDEFMGNLINKIVESDIPAKRL